MRDILGNSIRVDSLLWWISKSIPMRVARIEEPSLVSIDREGQAKTKLILELTVPIDMMTGGAETQLADFLCTINPNAEEIISSMLAGQRKQ